ncbi:Vps70p [Sugiyamaella lignohabitans]|uniref:Vps70p n=1 Tax=Sugiyamaella lignohabitans TaxID=796027 RepID=A0A167E9T5_9ASCO|nr:Vps70p [Sugiyamaella lignohabitans]ANB13816.1 Vps70p [Sugiyamaella lignohabitans]
MVVVRVDEESQSLIRGPNGLKVRKRRASCLRFGCYTLLGVFFLAVFNVIFLPRTSISRDWNRLHSIKVSDADVKRTLFQSVNASSIRDWSYKYTQEPHLAGTNYGLVEWTRDKFEEYGIPAEIVSYDIYLNYPRDHAVKLLNEDGSVQFSASLEEAVIEEDPTTSREDRVPTFHGYSASGNVTGQLIYVNYGTREDYDQLIAKGVDFKGKIVIARYGGIFRGLKVKFAQDLGAIGALLYSDPGDDGGITIKNGYEAYPNGPARHPSSVQRGSVQFLSLGPGDPTTPGWASKPDSKRVDPYDTIPSIPSIPISYEDALPLLKAINGKGLKGSDLGENWVGELTDEFDYSVGPSTLEVNLYNDQDYDIRPTYNVIGKIEGIISDEAIVIGNHRDAWIAGGAGDPNSGSAALIELAKAFGELKKIGWKPSRTIILGSWDGEEYGLLGSTEWGEDNAEYLQHHVIAYLNVDVAFSGSRFGASASPLLDNVLIDVTKQVPAPSGNGTLYDLWYSQNGARISSLGSGSDYTVFQDYLGIPSVDFGFGGGKGDPVYQYHSNYDSFYWMDKFGDKDFAHHSVMVKAWGLLTLTLSETELIPFKLASYAKLLDTYLEKTESQLPKEIFDDGDDEYDDDDDFDFDFSEEMSVDMAVAIANADSSALASVNPVSSTDVSDTEVDAQQIFTRPKHRKPKHPKRKLHKEARKAFEKLRKEVDKFKTRARKYDAYTERLQEEFTQDYAWFYSYKKLILLVKIKVANIKLAQIEQLFTYDKGLDNGRSWFKHVVFAPGINTGYAGALLPGLTEAIDARDPSAILKWATIIRASVTSVNALVSK